MCRNALIVTTAFIVIACGGGDLSRREAARLISEHQKLAEPWGGFVFQQGGFANWQAQGGLNNPRFAADVTRADGSGFTLRRSVAPEVKEVTGIGPVPIPGAADAIQEIQFTWGYKDKPPDWFSRFQPLGGTGTAIARRFDDGWRIESVNLDFPPVAPAAADSDAIAADVRAEQDRQGRAEKEQQQRVADRHASLARAGVPTQTIAEFEVRGVTGGCGEGSPPPSRRIVVVTDVDVAVPGYIWCDKTPMRLLYQNVNGVQAPGPSFMGTDRDINVSSPYWGLGVTLRFENVASRDKAAAILKAAHAKWHETYGHLLNIK